jgi:hypothetical protein
MSYNSCRSRAWRRERSKESPMTRRSIGLLLAPVAAFALTAAAGTSASPHPSLPSASTVAPGADVSPAPATDLQQKGRYKKQGNNCVWDENDGGPNQCTPQVKGRFKKGGDDSCKWDANDVGPDQCRPPKGRWKKGGDNSCTWDANDGGPDQCNPRQAR